MKQDNRTLAIIIALLIVQFLSVTLIALVNFEVFKDWHDDSLEIYYTYASRLLNGEMPYRDYSMEYPPLALIAFCLPYLFSLGREVSLDQYAYLYLAIVVLISLAASVTMLILSQSWRPEKLDIIQTLGITVFSTALTTPLFAWRYDIFPAFLTLLVVALIVKKKPGLAGFCMGVAVLVKLYPIVLIPIIAVYYFTSKDFRDLKRFLMGGVLSTLLLIPFFVFAPKWLFQFLNYHSQRGLNIETLFSGLIMAFHRVGNNPIKVISAFSSFQLASPQADQVLRWLPALLIFSFALVIASCIGNFQDVYKRKGFIPTENLAAYIVIALIAFILTNKVLSPQYVIWLLPFLPFLKIQHTSVAIVIGILTFIIFPLAYVMIIEIQPLGILLLNLRNALFLCLLIWLILDYKPRLIIR